MLHADSFNLGDSMSALEMMDPKMDAGVINEKNKSIVPAGLHTALFLPGVPPARQRERVVCAVCAVLRLLASLRGCHLRYRRVF